MYSVFKRYPRFKKLRLIITKKSSNFILKIASRDQTRLEILQVEMPIMYRKHTVLHSG